MRILAIADDDDLVGQIELRTVDLLVSLGDLMDSTIEKAYAKYAPVNTFSVRGNHDADVPFAPFVTPLHGAIQSIAGLTFGGFGGSWRYKPRGCHLYEQEEVTRLLRTFPAVDVFVAHNSPRGVHERDRDTHQGFDGFLEYIQRARPKYFLHGHQHRSAITRIGETTVIGVFGETFIDIQP